MTDWKMPSGISSNVFFLTLVKDRLLFAYDTQIWNVTSLSIRIYRLTDNSQCLKIFDSGPIFDTIRRGTYSL